MSLRPALQSESMICAASPQCGCPNRAGRAQDVERLPSLLNTQHIPFLLTWHVRWSFFENPVHQHEATFSLGPKETRIKLL